MKIANNGQFLWQNSCLAGKSLMNFWQEMKTCAHPVFSWTDLDEEISISNINKIFLFMITDVSSWKVRNLNFCAKYFSRPSRIQLK